MAHRLLTFLFVALFLIFARTEASAQSIWEKLVSPGELSEVHAKYEKTCESCHEPFSKESQRRLCLECHKDISSDIAGKKGLHGKRPDIVRGECKICHSDHKGRPFDILQFDRETFSHNSTNFVLKGAHVSAPCEGCHQKGQKYRKAASDCYVCHKDDDNHKGSLGKECANCHGEEGWKKQKTFDHSKTKFALEGAHKKVACVTCHIGEKYKDLPTTCVSCHKVQDVHKGRYGEKCQTCHKPDKWKTISFDHTKDTKFPLRGSHEKVKCDACHRGDLYKDKLPLGCFGCHKNNDVHKGELGKACEKCHNETAWRQKVTFDHDLTRFPLIGQHAAIPCEDCHKTNAYRDTPMICSSCHKDDYHLGRVGNACQHCHNPNGWKLWRFNHDKETKFPLTGAHKGIKCHTCHTTRAEAKVTAPTACFGCHSKDDAHRGSFGRSCEKCHVTTGFRDGLIRR